jgi:hypothetical protein
MVKLILTCTHGKITGGIMRRSKYLNFKPQMIINKNDELFAQARNESPLIQRVLDGGGSMQDVIVTLHGFCKELIQENMRLDAIAPYKMVDPADGKTKIVMPPEDSVPFKVFNAPKIEVAP